MTVLARQVPGTSGHPQSGVAAIEFVLVIPVLLILFFGTINITQYIAMQRRVYAAAELVNDLVTRHDTNILTADIDDYFIAAGLSLNPIDINRVGIDVYDFYKVNGASRWRWKSKWPKPDGQTVAACGTIPTPNPADTGDRIGNLLNDGNDVVVVVVCTNFIPPVQDFPGLFVFDNLTVSQQVAFSPRQSVTLKCADCTLPPPSD